MPKKTYSKTGSLSRSDARKAVLGVKKARSAAKKAGGGKKAGGAKKASSAYIKRYLGHFGFGLHTTSLSGLKSGASKKKSGTKKVSSAAKKFRRAS